MAEGFRKQVSGEIVSDEETSCENFDGIHMALSNPNHKSERDTIITESRSTGTKRVVPKNIRSSYEICLRWADERVWSLTSICWY